MRLFNKPRERTVDWGTELQEFKIEKKEVILPPSFIRAESSSEFCEPLPEEITILRGVNFVYLIADDMEKAVALTLKLGLGKTNIKEPLRVITNLKEVVDPILPLYQKTKDYQAGQVFLEIECKKFDELAQSKAISLLINHEWEILEQESKPFSFSCFML